MPQPVRFRAAGSPALRGPRPAAGARARVLFAALGVALCTFGALVAAPAHAQQEVSGQIYIPGPGERAGSDAATMAAMIDARRSAAAASPAQPAASAALPAGMISIPGPGERGAQPQAAATAPNVITIPGPGERSAQPSAATAAPNMITIPGPGERGAAQVARVAPHAPATPAAQAQLPRVTVAAAANRVAPVVVRAPPAAAAAASTAPAANGNATATAQAAQAALAATAQPPVPAGQQDGESIRAAALAFLQQQSAGLPGRVSITVAPVFPRGLAACASLEPFLPPGARMWGRTTVGVRCIGAKPWTLYVQARVAVEVTYYTAARPIAPGETLSVADLLPRDGDLASLPQTVITDRAQALGAVSLARIAAGLPLRTDMLRSASSVVIGQTVKLVADGPNFSISTEGSVLNNAAPGQQVQVRTGGGQIVTGIVKDAGTVQVQI